MYFTVTDFFVYLNYSYMNDLLQEYITSIKYIYKCGSHCRVIIYTSEQQQGKMGTLMDPLVNVSTCIN